MSIGSNKSTLLGHLACFGAYCIFGFNIVCCKNISNANVLAPMDLFCFRATGATVLFWLLSLFMPKEKVDLKDLPKIFVASMLGLFLTQMSFLKAITMTTSIDLSIANTCTPIMTMFVAAIALKEPITAKKIGGVLISLAGVLFLIFNSVGLGGGASETKPLGIVLTIMNALTFALYLGIFRPLISKYNVVTFMKWMFLFSMLVALPLNIKSLIHIPFAQMESKVLWQVAYVVVFATFIAYFLIPVGQKRLRPTLVSMYNYVQPIIATLISIVIGLDHLTWKKLVAMVLVFTGVWVVNQSRAAIPVHHRTKAIVLLLIVFVSCKHPRQYQTGDLLFVEGSTESAMDQAIMGSTGMMVHVGIIEVASDSVFVIDAAPKTGVSRRPLQAFLETQKEENGALPNLKHTRLKDNCDAAAFVAKAKSLCGADYNFTFLPDNDSYYCSELVFECYQRDGKPVFESAPMNFRNTEGEFDPFWVELFAKQGMEIPQNVSGTNPDALFHSPMLLEIKEK